MPWPTTALLRLFGFRPSRFFTFRWTLGVASLSSASRLRSSTTLLLDSSPFEDGEGFGGLADPCLIDMEDRLLLELLLLELEATSIWPALTELLLESAVLLAW